MLIGAAETLGRCLRGLVEFASASSRISRLVVQFLARDIQRRPASEPAVKVSRAWRRTLSGVVSPSASRMSPATALITQQAALVRAVACVGQRRAFLRIDRVRTVDSRILGGHGPGQDHVDAFALGHDAR